MLEKTAAIEISIRKDMAMKLDCGHEPSPHGEHTTGYGIVNNKKFCYECCAEMDKKQMREEGRITLYLGVQWKNGTMFNKLTKIVHCKNELTNWPGSLRIPCWVHSHRHNIARRQYSVRFEFEGQKWHGRMVGDNTELCHCKRNKVQPGNPVAKS